MGFYLSVSGYINKPHGSDLREMLSKGLIPLDRLCLETDAPYMGFNGCRKEYVALDSKDVGGKEKKKQMKKQYPNVPSALPLVLKGVVEALNSGDRVEKVTEEFVARSTTAVAKDFFQFE